MAGLLQSWLLRRAVGRWLGAERAGADVPAERALRGAFRRLPVEPPPGLAAAVMARLGAPAIAAGVPARVAPWAAAACLLVGGVGVFFCLPAARALASTIGLGDVLVALTGVVGSALEIASAALARLAALLTAGRAVSSVLQSPLLAAVLLVCTALSAAATRFLYALMGAEGSSNGSLA